MATFTIQATITIDGKHIKSRKDAVNELQVMLNDYEDNNSESGTGISIQVDSVTKEKYIPPHFYEPNTCPFCGSHNTTEHQCNECGRLISEDDRIIEPIRHVLSAFLAEHDATEEHPYNCNIAIGWLQDGEDGKFVDEPHVVGIFEATDIIYVKIKEFDEPWDIDALPTSDIVNIAEELNL